MTTLSAYFDPMDAARILHCKLYGSNITNIFPMYNTDLKPSILIRPLEYLGFRGNAVNFVQNSDDFVLTNISNLNGPIHFFDIKLPFQPNRVNLKSKDNLPQISFEDIIIDFQNLSLKLKTPSISNCFLEDSNGICLKCSHGFFFTNDFSNCLKCDKTFFSVYNLCTENLIMSPSSNHSMISETVNTQKNSTTSPLNSDVSYFSYFGLSSVDASNTFTQSLTTDDNLDYFFKIKMNLEISNVQNINDILVPYNYFVQFSNDSYCKVETPVYVSRPNDYTLDYEIDIFFYRYSGTNLSNYIIPLPNSTISTASGLSASITVSFTSFSLENLILEQFNQGNDLLPIQMKSLDFFVTPFGPFHNKNVGSETNEVGYNYMVRQNSGNNIRMLCDEGCSSCTFTNSCRDCVKGYFFNLDETRCLKCSKECLTCVDHPEKCLKCKQESVSFDESKQKYMSLTI